MKQLFLFLITIRVIVKECIRYFDRLVNFSSRKCDVDIVVKLSKCNAKNVNLCASLYNNRFREPDIY